MILFRNSSKKPFFKLFRLNLKNRFSSHLPRAKIRQVQHSHKIQFLVKKRIINLTKLKLSIYILYITMNQKMKNIKIIAQRYKIIKPLFKVNNYLYAQSILYLILVCYLKTFQVLNAAIVLFFSYYLVSVRKLGTRTKSENVGRKIINLLEQLHPQFDIPLQSYKRHFRG